MKQRPVDANSLHGKFLREYELNRRLNKKDFAGAWQGAMQLLYDAPTIEPAKQEWISVKDKLPERTLPPHDVLVYHDLNCGMFVDRAWYSYDMGKWCSVLGMKLKVTHWMPLPEPPKEL